MPLYDAEGNLEGFVGNFKSTIKTAGKKGKTIVINYDMQLPRPYDNR